ncbi:hypothetical protein QJQ45_022775 [Haematococcus lacustris]|nr:hypothetical protein QJQ45_022775 [Haematococcus lacustris]
MLQDPDDSVAATHIAEVIANTSADVVVRDAGDGRGRGIYTTRKFVRGDTIFIERPWVAMQHVANRPAVLVCSHCFRHLGSVEQQIARLLLPVCAQLGPQPGAALPGGLGVSSDSPEPGAAPPCSTAPGEGWRSSNEQQQQQQEVEEEEEEVEVDEEMAERVRLLLAHVRPEEVVALSHGALRLPLSDTFTLPTPVACRRCCGEVFCSAGCEAAAWQVQHCMLCPAGPPAPGTFCSAASAPSCLAASGPGPSCSAAACPSPSRGLGKGYSSHDHAASSPPAPLNPPPAPSVEEEVMGLAVVRSALPAFAAHAAATNDIFLLAAKAVVQTALAARRLLEQHGQQQQQRAQLHQGTGQEQGEQLASQEACPELSSQAALAQAWLPLGVGWKAAWWEAVAVPEDVQDEAAFREELRALAADSLQLLVAALPGVAAAFPSLLALDTWGALVGLFELNNLGLAVPSPVEDYFLLVDGLAEGAEKEEVQRQTGRWLDALDRWYDTCCEGTGFYCLQSCANHSCAPSAATEGLASGATALLALKDLAPGEEVTLSYIGELEAEGGRPLGLKERQAMLRDWGFVCRCSRCLSEAAAKSSSAKKLGARAGVKVGRR